MTRNIILFGRPEQNTPENAASHIDRSKVESISVGREKVESSSVSKAGLDSSAASIKSSPKKSKFTNRRGKAKDPKARSHRCAHKSATGACLRESAVVSLPVGDAREEFLRQVEERAFIGTSRAYAKMHLENLTGGKIIPFEAVSEGAAEDMGSKFQHRIEVGWNQDGKPLYRWATGNTLAESTDAVSRINAEFIAPPSDDVPTRKAHKGTKHTLFEDYVSRWYAMFMEARLGAYGSSSLQEPAI